MNIKVDLGRQNLAVTWDELVFDRIKRLEEGHADRLSFQLLMF